MATDATFADGFVFENKRAALRGVTLEARVILAEQSHASSFEALWKIRAASLDRVALVRVVAIGATHFPFQHRMVMRQLKRGAHFRVALEASGRRFSRIDDCAFLAAALDVQAAGAVTRFATNVLGVVSLSFQARVSGRPEITRDRFMAGGAFL